MYLSRDIDIFPRAPVFLAQLHESYPSVEGGLYAPEEFLFRKARAVCNEI